MTIYDEGYRDGKNGIQPKWQMLGHTAYMKGHAQGFADLYRPKRSWWWPF